MPAIWQRLEAEGLLTTEACGDTPRVILGSPGRRASPPTRRSTRSPAIDAILERYIGNPEFSNLPRKFKTAISWQQDVAHEVNDVSFVGVVHPEHGPGFDVWVGGGLSTNPKIAQRLGAWVPLDEVPDVWAGVIGDLPRLRLPPAAPPRPASSSWSPTGAPRSSARCWRRSTSAARCSTAPRPRSPPRPIDHIGVHKQRDGRNYVGVAPAVGPGLGHHADRAGRRRRARRVAAGCGSPRSRRSSCWTCPTPTVDAAHRASCRRSGCRPSRRRGGAPRWRAPASSSASSRSSRPRNARSGWSSDLEKRLADVYPDAADLHPPQRLPQRLRPHPGRRHRAQGQIVTDARGQPGRGLPGAPRRRPRAWTPGSAASCAGSRSPAPSWATTSSGSCARYVEQRDRGRAVRPVGAARRRGRPEVTDSRNERAGCALLLPVLRRRGPAARGGRPHGAWYCAACLRTFTLKMIGIGVPYVRLMRDRG